MTDKNHHRLLLVLAVITLPVVITCLLPYFSFDATLLDFVPASVNDETHYWHEIATFSRVGFAGGYYTIEERPAPFYLSHFGPHGPIFPILYGTIGHFVGWRTYSGPIFNLLLITVALCIFIRSAKLDNKQLGLTGLFLLTFWPLLFFVPTNMQTGLHYTIAVILAGMFHTLLSRSENISTWFKVSVLLFVIFASLIRPSWSLLLVPFFILGLRDKSTFTIFLSFIKSGVLVFAVFWGYTYLAAPFPSSSGFFFIKVLTLQSSPEALFRYAQVNLTNLMSLQRGDLLEISQRYQFLFIFGLLLGGGGVVLFRHLGGEEKLRDTTQVKLELLFHLYNLGAILVATVFLYIVDNWGDYRVLTPHLLLTVLLLIASKRKYWLGLAGLTILSNIIFTLIFMNSYRENRSVNFVYDRQSITSFQEAIQGSIVYDEEQGPWCNTLLSTVYPYQFVALPPGIGISMLFRSPENLEFPLKSKYLLIESDMLREDSVDYLQFRHQLKNVKLLEYTQFGVLYLNLDAECE